MYSRIRKLRKALELTQQEFGRRIGIKQNSVALIESNKRSPSSQLILSICREFGASERWLRDGVGEMFVEVSTHDELADLARRHNLSGIDLKIVEAYINMPDDKKNIAKAFILGLTKAVENGEVGTVDEYLEHYAAAPSAHSSSSSQTSSTSSAPKLPEQMSDAEIEAEVEAYRHDLELQRRTAAKSSLSDGTND